MKHLLVELNDLPDEILMIILEKLLKVEVLYSLIGVNKRLSRIVHDPIFTNCLLLMTYSSDGFIDPLSDPMLDRFCSKILPAIHYQIKWLNLESSSMERILRATNYPNLCGLGLFNMNVETALSLFKEESFLGSTFKKQITSLDIDGIADEKIISIRHTLVFTQIFSLFNNLKYLNFNSSACCYSFEISFFKSVPNVFSSTLLELHVTLKVFNDCLYLLDGRFNQLHTLHVDVSVIHGSDLTMSNKGKISNLKFFSLHCNMSTNDYDELIVPLLQRMSNLEKLDLYLIVCGKQTFIDGNELKKNIINHMSRLNKFSFNIRSIIRLYNQINLASNQDIQHTFEDFQDNQIISCVDYFSQAEKGQCLIYSYPYRLKYYDRITNNFSGDLFECVREITLFDEQPFEHEFFLRISHSFPFMQSLTLFNTKPQQKILRSRSKQNNQDIPIIKYPHLVKLNLTEAHIDYIEQFLVHWKTSLTNIVRLSVGYRSLRVVTRDFRRNTTRINCTKLIPICIYAGNDWPQYVKNYFPCLRIF
ncbi:unnamed protein product [Rotaria sp. Silwood2]|nr:unnamed protein product [Rotaria sp. Silwood2]CAF4118782.1 unnamed protein product [Rotaria sp. Silwood2]